MLWAERAVCKGEPTSMFFPLPRTGVAYIAKALCGSCPVQTDCLTYALRTDQPDGIWGGMTADERQALPRAAAAPSIKHGTYGGYSAHRRRGETACAPCLEARAIHARVQRGDSA